MIQTRDELEQLLIELEPKLRQEFGLSRIGFFGSFARNEQRKRSDVDIIYDAPKDSFGLRGDLNVFLKEHIGRNVGFVYAVNIRKEYEAGIMEDARFVENGRFSGGHDFSQNPTLKIRRKKMDDAYLNDILKAMNNLINFTTGVHLKECRKNLEKIMALERGFQILGEAIKMLSPQLKQRYPEIPWQDWANLRNKVVHSYDDDYTQIMWDNIHNVVIPLLDTMKKIVASESKN